MAIINKTGITDGGTIQSEHVTRAIDALSGGSTDTVVATGSFSGSFTGTASFAVTSSYALNAGTSGNNNVSLQFTHGTWITSSTTPYYYGNYGSTQPFIDITKIGVASPWTGTLVSASISVFNENPSGANKINFSVVRDGAGTPVSKSISTAQISTANSFGSDTYVKSLVDPTPFTASFGDMLSIKIVSTGGAINGLNCNSTVTLIFEV